MAQHVPSRLSRCMLLLSAQLQKAAESWTHMHRPVPFQQLLAAVSVVFATFSAVRDGAVPHRATDTARVETLVQGGGSFA